MNPQLIGKFDYSFWEMLWFLWIHHANCKSIIKLHCDSFLGHNLQQAVHVVLRRCWSVLLTASLNTTRMNTPLCTFVIISNGMYVSISGCDCSHLLRVFLLWFTRLERWLGSLWTPQLLALRAQSTNSCLSPMLSLSSLLRGPCKAQKEFTSQVILRYTWRNRFRFFCTPRHHHLIIIPLSCFLFLYVDFLPFSSAVCFVVSTGIPLSPALLMSLISYLI